MFKRNAYRIRYIELQIKIKTKVNFLYTHTSAMLNAEIPEHASRRTYPLEKVGFLAPPQNWKTIV
jgi:hypothetical protein